MNLRERREFAAGLDTDELWLYILTLLFELARRIGLPHPPESLENHSDDDAENPQTRMVNTPSKRRLARERETGGSTPSET